jgi:hypothetical protein
MNGYPCPNPSCYYVFPAEVVKGAATLPCPICRKVFEFGPAAPRPAPPAAKAPAPKAAGPVTPRVAAAPPPAAVPAPAPAVAAPVAPPPAPEAPLEDLTASPRVRAAARRRRRRRGTQAVLLALVLLTGAGLAAAGAYRLWDWLEDGGETGRPYESERTSFRFEMPRKGWKPDDEARRPFKGSLALRRTAPAAWLVIAAEDYSKKRPPREADLVEESVRRLKDHFRSLEYERKPDATLAGRPALLLEFQGDARDVVMNGECYVLAHQDVVYWFVVWAPLADRAAVADEWDRLRKGFTVKDREGWVERVPKLVTVQGEGHDQVPYVLRYVEGIWRTDPAKNFGDRTDLGMTGFEPDKPRLAGDSATFQVLLLPKQPDLDAAVQAAKDDLLERQKKLYPETTVEPLADKAGPVDRRATLGNARGHLVKLRVLNGDNRVRFVVLGVVWQPDYVLVLDGDCDIQRQAFWEQEFMQILGTFQLKTPGAGDSP